MVNKLYNREYVYSIAAKTGFIKDNTDSSVRFYSIDEI